MAENFEVAVDEKSVLEIVKSKNVTTFFQPIVSISTKSIVGFEAFSRGGGGNICVIDSSMLFHDALSPNLKVDVDRLCREKALEQFKPIYGGHKQMLLFLNVNADILPYVESGSKVLMHQVSSMGIECGNVAIECTLNRSNTDVVETFARIYKGLGFKISLDNCSVDDAFSQVISRIRPNFVKVNRSFYAKGLRKDYSSKSLEGLIAVADSVGAVVIAQGVESEEDSIQLLTAGVHLQQGYYYTKDENARTNDPAKMFFQKIITSYDKFKKVKRELVRRKKERFDTTFKLVAAICAKFANLSEARFEDACKALVQNMGDVISMFVLDETGEQITARMHVKPAPGKAVSGSILGSQRGVDHSMHDYVMYLDMGYEKFVTQAFMSPFTGEQACLISKPFYNSEGLRYIMCIELLHPGSLP